MSETPQNPPPLDINQMLALQQMMASMQAAQEAPDEDEIQIDFRRIWLLIRKYLWGILGLSLSITVLTYLVLLAITPVYRATAKLVIEPKTSRVVSVDDVYGMDTSRTEYLQTQFKILESRTLARRVIERLHLADYPEFKPKDKVAEAAADIAAEDAAAGKKAAPAGKGKVAAAQQTAAGKQMAGGVGAREASVAHDESGASVESVDEADPLKLDEEEADADEHWLPFMPDNEEAERLTAEVDPLEKVLTKFQSRLTVAPVAKTQLVDISFDSQNPELAMKVANELAKVYIESTLEARVEATQEATNWLASRLEGLRNKLTESERRLQDYLEKEKLVDVKGVGTVSADQLKVTSDKLIDARRARVEAEAEWALVTRYGDQLAENVDKVPSVYQDPLIQRLKEEEAKSEALVADAQKHYGAQHPDRLRAEAQLHAVRNNLLRAVNNVVQGLKLKVDAARAGEAAIASHVEGVKGELRFIGRKETNLNELQREVESNRNLYEMFFTRLKETSEAGQLQPANARVVDMATLPYTIHKPKKAMITAIALVLSLFIGVALAFMLEFLDKSLKSGDEVEQKLGVPLLGMVPLIDRGQLKTGNTALPAAAEAAGDKRSQRKAAKVAKEGDIGDTFREFLLSPRSNFAEAIRGIRTSVLLSGLDNPHKVVMVTSTVPGEGKTTMSLSLVTALAQMERVLIIDADMRKPTIAKRCRMPRSPGLSELAAHTATIDQCIHRFEEGNFDVLPSGVIPPNPQELLASKRFGEVIAELETMYDAIIIDTPPLQPVSDALTVSRYARSVIYVAKAEAAPVNLIRLGLKRLRTVQAPIIGVVLSQVDLNKRNIYGEYYYGSYYKYYRYEGYYHEDGADA